MRGALDGKYIAMRRYEWYSELTPEQVRARLLVRARPMRIGWMYEEHQVFAKLLPDGRFYLLKTGGMRQVRPQLPFVGTLTESEQGCYISGGFQPTRAMRNFLLGAMAAAFLMGLAFAGASAFALTVLPVCVLLWGGLGWFLWTKLAPEFGRRQQEETIAFIENDLLKKKA